MAGGFGGGRGGHGGGYGAGPMGGGGMGMQGGGGGRQIFVSNVCTPFQNMLSITDTYDSFRSRLVGRT